MELFLDTAHPEHQHLCVPCLQALGEPGVDKGTVHFVHYDGATSKRKMCPSLMPFLEHCVVGDQWVRMDSADALVQALNVCPTPPAVARPVCVCVCNTVGRGLIMVPSTVYPPPHPTSCPA